MANVTIPDLSEAFVIAGDTYLEASVGGNSKKVPLSMIAQLFGMGGVRYVFDSTTTNSNPGASKIRLNNATLASVTAIYINELDGGSADLEPFFEEFSSGHVMLTNEALSDSYAIYKINSIVDSTGYRTLSVKFLTADGAFANNNILRIYFMMTSGGGVMKGLKSWAEQYSDTLGASQVRRSVLRVQTANNTATAATLDGAAEAAGNVLALDNNSTYAVRATITARRPSNGDSKAWALDFLVKRGANAAATALVGAATVTVIAADAGASSWTVDGAAQTSLGAARFMVTGATSQTIDWVVAFESVERVG